MAGQIFCRSASIPCSTVGCAVSVIAHQYRAGSAEEQTELIELWDIGGSLMHQKASSVFLEGFFALICFFALIVL